MSGNLSSATERLTAKNHLRLMQSLMHITLALRNMANIPGAYLGQNNHQASLIPSSASRNGKFAKIKEFMDTPDRNPPLELSHELAIHADLKPGWIIHIQDQDVQTRLGNRVMLVLAKCNQSVTCVNFCRHWPPPNPEDHWQVSTEDSNAGQNRESETHLKIVLQPYGETPQVSVKPSITVDIQGLWNVENEIPVAYLGHADPASFCKLVKAAKNLICNSLDKAIEASKSPKKVAPKKADRRRHSWGYS